MNRFLKWIHATLLIGALTFVTLFFILIVFLLGDPKEFLKTVLGFVDFLFVFCVTFVLYLGPFFDGLKERLGNENTRKIVVPFGKSGINVAYLIPRNLSGVARSVLYGGFSFSQTVFLIVLILFPAFLFAMEMMGFFGLGKNLVTPLLALGIASSKVFLELWKSVKSRKAKTGVVLFLWSLLMGLVSVVFVVVVAFTAWTEGISLFQALENTLFNAYYLVWIITYLTITSGITEAMKLD